MVHRGKTGSNTTLARGQPAVGRLLPASVVVMDPSRLALSPAAASSDDAPSRPDILAEIAAGLGEDDDVRACSSAS